MPNPIFSTIEQKLARQAQQSHTFLVQGDCAVVGASLAAASSVAGHPAVLEGRGV